MKKLPNQSQSEFIQDIKRRLIRMKENGVLDVSVNIQQENYEGSGKDFKRELEENGMTAFDGYSLNVTLKGESK